MDEFRITIHEEWNRYLSLSELASLTRTHPETILAFAEYGLIEPVHSFGDEPAFPLSAIHKIRTILRLRHDMGVNLAGIAVIMELLDKIKQLQAEVDWLR